MEDDLQNPSPTTHPDFSDELDSCCSTPYVSAPSSPGRPPATCYYYSAPTSTTTNLNPYPPTDASASSFEFDFSAAIPSASADELFFNGQIRPMKLSTHLQRPQFLAPLIESDDDIIEEVRGRDPNKFRAGSLRTRTRSTINMLEEISTSSSSAVGEPLENFIPPGPAGDPSSSETTQALNFSSGNPRIEEIRGIVHLYRNDVAPSSSQLPVERKPLVCVLGVPNHMTYADFCQFCGSFIQSMLEMRIVRTEGLEDRYSILVRLEDQNSADSFYKHFNGKAFSSLEEEKCHLYFTVDIQYTGSIEHSQPLPASFTEQPSCAVCLERLDQDLGGILTTICNHSFHCSCISRWSDSSCPVCRFCQQQPEKSICYVCQTSEKLWMCVLCGFVGCGRYKEGHAVDHWKETQHCYSLELESQRVWDYVGNNYVHRLIQSKTDGKLVELKHHCMHHDGGCSDCIGYADTQLDSEVEAIKKEYNELLTSQLENQKTYFESLLQEVEEDTERETSVAVKKALIQNPKLLKLQAKLNKCLEEKRFHDDINDNLFRNQGIWESKIVKIEQSENELLKLKDGKIEELEKQLRIMMACLETENGSK